MNRPIPLPAEYSPYNPPDFWCDEPTERRRSVWRARRIVWTVAALVTVPTFLLWAIVKLFA